jgi:cadmium resistance protein CadD (predicted permease)
MNWFVSALITGAVAFSATNIDDIVFLTIFFSQAGHRWHVVIGQYLGFTPLVLVSLIGFFGGQVFPARMASPAWCRSDSNRNQKVVR